MRHCQAADATLKLTVLRSRAELLGAHPLQLDSALDDDEPKQALLDLIRQQELEATEGSLFAWRPGLQHD